MKIEDARGIKIYEYKEYKIYKEPICFTLYKRVTNINPKTKQSVENHTILGYFGKINLALNKILNDIVNVDISNPQALQNLFTELYQHNKHLAERMERANYGINSK